MALHFHWRLLQGGEGSGVTRARQTSLRDTALPDLERQVHFCRAAETGGIESVLVDINFAKPDPIALATALGMSTERLGFMIAVRSGLLSPTLFTQQINTVSTLTSGRVSLNVVAGHSPVEQRYYGDFLSHDERYCRTGEFLAICHGLWSGGGVDFSGKYYRIEGGRLNTPFVSSVRAHPEIFIGGSSQAACDLAVRYGTCWMRLGDTPEHVAGSVAPVLRAGKQAGMRLSIISAATREEALGAAAEVVRSLEPGLEEREREQTFVQSSDSVSIGATFELATSEWLTPYLWTGAVRSYGAPAMALVGTPEVVAEAIMTYKSAGISHFIFSGWPKLDAMVHFVRHILPLVREMEALRGRQGECRR